MPAKTARLHRVLTQCSHKQAAEKFYPTFVAGQSTSAGTHRQDRETTLGTVHLRMRQTIPKAEEDAGRLSLVPKTHRPGTCCYLGTVWGSEFEVHVFLRRSALLPAISNPTEAYLQLSKRFFKGFLLLQVLCRAS